MIEIKYSNNKFRYVYFLVFNICLGSIITGYSACIINPMSLVISKLNNWNDLADQLFYIALITTALPFGNFVGCYFSFILTKLIKKIRH